MLRSERISPAKNREYRLRAEARYPEKIRARWMTKDAVRTGKLVRQPCAECEAVPAEAHHTDYSKPLDVIWLCKKHHAEIHAMPKQARPKQRRTKQETPPGKPIYRRPFRAPSYSKTHCKRGHDLMVVGVYARKNGREDCGECKRLAANKRITDRKSPSAT